MSGHYPYSAAPSGDAHKQSAIVSVESAASSQRQRKCYWPFMQRGPVFVVLLAAMLSLIGLLEYGFRTLPGQRWNPPTLSVNVPDPLRLRARQAPTPPPSVTSPAAGQGTGPGVTPTPPPSSPPESVTPTPSEVFTPRPASTKPPDAFLNTQITVSRKGDGSSDAGAGVSHTLFTKPPDSFLNTAIIATPNNGAASPTPAVQTPGATPGSNGDRNGGSAGGVTATRPSSAFLQTTVGVVGPGATPGTPGAGTANRNGQTAPGQTGPSPAPNPTDATRGRPVVSGGGVQAFPRTGVSTSAASGSAATGTPGSGTTNNGVSGANSTDAANAFSASDPNRPNRGHKPLTVGRYILASYVPTLVAVVLRIVVGCLYATTKMMEPFVALASGGGGSGVPPKAFFHICYLATNDAFDLLPALFAGHWTMLATTALYVGVVLLAPFGAELVAVTRYCYDEGDLTYCGPEIRMNYTVARVLQGLLAASALLLAVVWAMHQRIARRNRNAVPGAGVFQDPSSIAALAVLLHHPAVVDDFRRLDPDASKADMVRALQHKRYALGWYSSGHAGGERYGIVPAGDYASSPVNEPAYMPLGGHNAHDNGVGGGNWQEKSQSQKRQRRLQGVLSVARDALLAVVTLGILVLIVIYYRNSDQNNALEKFMSSEKFGPRFLMTVVGMIIYGQWQRIEREVAIIEPYRRLVPRPGAAAADAKRTLLATRSLSPLATLARATLQRHFFVALMAAISVLAEALIVVLATLPFSAATLWRAYLVSFYIAWAILAAMLLGQAALAWRQRGDPPLPRAPDTLAAVWSYLCGAPALLGDVADLGAVSARRRDGLVRGLGRGYSLEKRPCADGAVRWKIDYAS